MIGVPDAAVGGIVAAVIAAAISFLGLVITKEQKISDFRQQWVDNLRIELAQYMTQLNLIVDASIVNFKSADEALEKLSPSISKMNDANFRILLFLNHDEELSRQIISSMNNFHDALSRMGQPSIREEMKAIERALIDASRALLKEEWKRVKRGEPVFRCAKWAAALVVVAGVAAVSMTSYRGSPLVADSPVHKNAEKPPASNN